jgi:hypothetical protein
LIPASSSKSAIKGRISSSSFLVLFTEGLTGKYNAIDAAATTIPTLILILYLYNILNILCRRSLTDVVQDWAVIFFVTNTEPAKLTSKPIDHNINTAIDSIYRIGYSVVIVGQHRFNTILQIWSHFRMNLPANQHVTKAPQQHAQAETDTVYNRHDSYVAHTPQSATEHC